MLALPGVLVNDQVTRPFYFGSLSVDPSNADVVFAGDDDWFRSSNGGKSFDRVIAHQGGHHDMWINPNNSTFMVRSN